MFLTLPGGIKMPALGLGTWQATDEKELETALNAALKAGYRHIDTAFVYQNEQVIGRVLKEWFDSGKIKREELFITTKLPMFGIHPDRVEKYMLQSLKNLQLDYVDLYLMHFPICGTEIGEGQKIIDIKAQPTDHIAVWKKMEEQVKLGRTKTIGVSNFNIRQIQRILNNCTIKPANLQVELHTYLQQRELVDFCHKNGITVVAYSPLGSPGINKFYEKLGLPDRKDLPDMLNDKTIAAIAKKYNKSPAQIMLRFGLQRNLAVIPKSVTPERLEENINVFDFNIDEEDMKKLYALEAGERARVANFEICWKDLTHIQNGLSQKMVEISTLIIRLI